MNDIYKPTIYDLYIFKCLDILGYIYSKKEILDTLYKNWYYTGFEFYFEYMQNLTMDEDQHFCKFEDLLTKLDEENIISIIELN